MSKSCLYVLTFLLALEVFAEATADIKFDSNAALDSILKNSRKYVTISSQSGTSHLLIGPNIGYVKFNTVPLSPKTKYKLTLRAYTDRTDCVESNNTALEFARSSYGRTYPEYVINIFDKAGKPLNLMLYGKIPIVYSAPIISRDAVDYVYVFYTPDAAAGMQLELRLNRNKLFIERFKLEKECSEGAINCNPDFRYGPLNPNGWHTQTRFFQTPEGKTVAQCEYYNGSPFFLLDEHNRYSFYCKGIASGVGASSATVNFYNVKGIKIGTTHLFHGKDMKNGGKKSGLKLPPGTFQAQVVVTNTILSEWRVTKD